LVESLQGEGGYVVPDPGFLPELRQLCNEHGILMILDEVQSGIGRTGKWWGIEHEGVQPDIVCFAKGIASGMPIGGILVPEHIMTWKPGAHGSTFGGNPIAAVAGNATLDVIEEEGLLDQATETGQYMMDALAEMQARHPSIGDVRGRGLMVGIEFVKDKASKERAPEIRNAVVQTAFETGLLMLQCGRNTLRMTPPLNISRPLVDEGLKIFEDALTDVERRMM
jgi:4-aminobutyrate aminotransferase